MLEMSNRPLYTAGIVRSSESQYWALPYLILCVALFLTLYQSVAAQSGDITDLRKELLVEVQSQRLEQAAIIAERLIVRLNEVYADPNEQKVAAYTDLGVIQQSLGQYERSIANLRKALDLLTSLRDSKLSTRLEIMRLLAISNERSGLKKAAREIYLTAAEIAESNATGDVKETFYIALGAANALANDSDYEAAHRYYLKALRLAYKHFEVDSKERYDLLIYRTCLYARNSDNRKRSDEYTKIRKELDENEAETKNIVHGKAVRLPRPSYPLAARTRRVGGTVYVSVSIDADGKVTDALALCSDRDLGGASENAAKNAKFSPTIKNGKAIPIKGLLTFVFVPPP